MTNKRKGRPRMPIEKRMVHTAVLLPPALIEKLKASEYGLSYEIRQRLMASYERPAKAKDIHDEQRDRAFPGQHVLLVGDIVSGFEAYGPFACGSDAVHWKQGKGARELTQGQWYLMTLKEPVADPSEV